MPIERTEYFECECGSEIIAISAWEDTDWEEGEIIMSLYSIGAGGHRPTWRYRIKYIWHIIRRGHPYSDAVVLSREEATRLSDTLREMGVAKVS